MQNPFATTASTQSIPTAKKKRSRWGLAVRIVISVGLVMFVYLTVDIHALFSTLRSLSVGGIMLILGLYTFSQVLSALKWHIFVSSVGLDRTFSQILRAYFFGMFVNTFGFGTVGGDVARSLALNPAKGQRAAAMATVVADRVHGLAVLLFIGVMALTIFHPDALGVAPHLLLSSGVLGLAGLMLLWWFGPTILVKVFPAGHRFSDSATLIGQAFPRTGKPFISATFISLLFHNVQILMHFVIAKELAAPLSLAYIYASVPWVNIVASLPFSIMNGLGVREAMYRSLFVPVGVTKEVAVAFGAIWVCTATIISALAGLFLAADVRRLRQADVDETDLSEDASDPDVKRAAN